MKDRTWPRNGIDYLRPGPAGEGGPASRRPRPTASTLLRRVSLDLSGLPPTPEEVERFVKDTSPDAYEKAVDRLLATRAYGERWAQVWLDLARYADSNGYGSDPLRTIWRYRDWVIDAFNRNLPYDRFTIEQIAGDLLPKPTRAADRHGLPSQHDDQHRGRHRPTRSSASPPSWIASTPRCRCGWA